jgi:hypothetical protein
VVFELMVVISSRSYVHCDRLTQLASQLGLLVLFHLLLLSTGSVRRKASTDIMLSFSWKQARVRPRMSEVLSTK